MKTELERLQQNLAVANSWCTSDAPAFRNHEKGPSLTFFQSVEDGVRRLNACWHHEDRTQVIVLEAGDVLQLERFCLDWRHAGMTEEELRAEATTSIARIDGLMAQLKVPLVVPR